MPKLHQRYFQLILKTNKLCKITINCISMFCYYYLSLSLSIKSYICCPSVFFLFIQPVNQVILRTILYYMLQLTVQLSVLFQESSIEPFVHNIHHSARFLFYICPVTLCYLVVVVTRKCQVQIVLSLANVYLKEGSRLFVFQILLIRRRKGYVGENC